jgi:hypothetical protein
MRAIELGSSFDRNSQSVLGYISASGWAELRSIVLVVDSTENTYDLQPNELEACFMDGLDFFVRVCTKMERFKLEMYNLGSDYRMNGWMVLEHVSKLSALRQLDLEVDAFNSMEPPQGLMLTFPKVEHVRLVGNLSKEFLDTFSTLSWPSLKTVEIPWGAWTSTSFTNFLENAPKLTNIDVLVGEDGVAPQTVDKLTESTWPCMHRMDFTLRSDVLAAMQDPVMMNKLRHVFPNASIHYTSPNGCELYYGVNATLDSRPKDLEHSCFAPDEGEEEDSSWEPNQEDDEESTESSDDGWDSEWDYI